MPRRPRHPWSGPGRVTIVTLALIGSWAAIGPEASASSVGEGRSRPSAHGGHRCKCGMDCGSTCCCAPDDRHLDTPAPPRPAAPTGVHKVTPGPCITSAPCGSLPTGPGPVVRVIEPADRSTPEGITPAPGGSLLAPPASDRAEVVPGSRLDEPPERLDDV